MTIDDIFDKAVRVQDDGTRSLPGPVVMAADTQGLFLLVMAMATGISMLTSSEHRESRLLQNIWSQNAEPRWSTGTRFERDFPDGLDYQIDDFDCGNADC